MNEDFVTYELAVKLKERGFNCMYPIAMYNERGVFHELYTSVGNMQYYDYDDFDERDTIAPTISQVLTWLREEKKIYLEIVIVVDAEYMCDIYKINPRPIECLGSTEYFKTYEQAALAGVNYCLENLI